MNIGMIHAYIVLGMFYFKYFVLGQQEVYGSKSVMKKNELIRRNSHLDKKLLFSKKLHKLVQDCKFTVVEPPVGLVLAQ